MEDTYIMSRRISLSPFPSLRHHFRTLLFGSSLLQHSSSFYHIPRHSVHPAITIPSLSANSSNPVSLCRFLVSTRTPFHSPFLSVSHFYSSPSLPVSRLPVSTRFPFPVSIRFSPPLPVRSAGRSAVLPPIKLPITDRCCLAIMPCYSVTFLYIKPYTMIVRPQFVID